MATEEEIAGLKATRDNLALFAANNDAWPTDDWHVGRAGAYEKAVADLDGLAVLHGWWPVESSEAGA